MKNGFPPFDYMLENWTFSQINLMEKGLAEIMEFEAEAHERVLNSGRGSRSKRVSPDEFMAAIGVKRGLPPKVK